MIIKILISAAFRKIITLSFTSPGHSGGRCCPQADHQASCRLALCFNCEDDVWVGAAVATLLHSACIHVSSYFYLSGFIRSIFIITSSDLWPRSNWSNGNYISVYLPLLFFSPNHSSTAALSVSHSILPALLSNPLCLCLALIVYHYLSYTGNRITAIGSYSGRSCCLSVYVGDIHNCITERKGVCTCVKTA